MADVRLGGMSSRADSIHRALREVARARRKHGLAASPRLQVALAASTIGACIHGVLGERTFNFLADGYRALRGKPRLWTR